MPARLLGDRQGLQHKGKVLFTPWEQVLPGTHSPLWHASLPTCTSPSRRQLVPAPHEALALGTAFSLAPGSTKFAGTWEMPWWGRAQHQLGLCA